MYKRSKRMMSLLLSLIIILGITTPVLAEKENESVKIDIVSLNDFHGAVVGNNRNPGMPKIVGYSKELVKNNPNTIFVSGGDSYQGTAISNINYGKPVSDMFKLMGLELSSVGNHEFDWGAKYIPQWAEDGNIKFLAANIKDKETNLLVPWVKPYEIIEKDGVKVAFIGLAHEETSTLTKKENTEGLIFTDAKEALELWTDYLLKGKAEEGKPDIIIALTHIDSKQEENGEVVGGVTELAKVKGVNGIISGHSHKRVAGKYGDVGIVQAGDNGQNFAVLSFEMIGKEIKDVTPKLINLRGKIDELPVDEEAQKILDEYVKKSEELLNQPLGIATDTFNHGGANVSQLGEWATDVIRKAAEVDIAIQNGGGLRKPLEKGDITMKDLYDIMPFDNTIVKTKIKGSKLIELIEHGILNPNAGDGQFVGLYVEFNKNAPYKERITKITLEDGTPIKLDEYYEVATHDFMLTGGDNYDFGEDGINNAVDTGLSLRDSLVDAVKDAKVLTPKNIDYIVDISDQVLIPKLNKKDHIAYMEGYDDGLLRPEGSMTREEVAVVIYRLLDKDYRDSIESNKISFPDVNKDRWSSKEISTLTNADIIEGYEDGTFKPGNSISRSEVIKILSQFSQAEVGNEIFNDSKGHWAEEYIKIAIEEQWINGYEDGTFKPDNPISRAEFVNIVNKVLGRKAKLENMLAGRIEFRDLDNTAWYFETMQEAINSHKYKIEDDEEIWIELIK